MDMEKCIGPINLITKGCGKGGFKQARGSVACLIKPLKKGFLKTMFLLDNYKKKEKINLKKIKKVKNIFYFFLD